MGTLINLDQNLDLIKMKMVGEDEAGPLKEDQEMMELEDEVEEGLRLDTLPAEILLSILEHLDVKFISVALISQLAWHCPNLKVVQLDQLLLLPGQLSLQDLVDLVQLVLGLLHHAQLHLQPVDN